MQVREIFDLVHDLRQNRPVHSHATGEDLLGLLVVAALLLLSEVVAEHLRPFGDQPFGGRLGQAR